MTHLLPASAFAALREFLRVRGFEFEDRPHQVFLARGPKLTVNLYSNGKVVFAGSDDLLVRELRFFLDSHGARDVVPGHEGLPPLEVSGTRVGLDEAGKGEYFGPLVVGGVLVTEAQAATLRGLGVRDSKTLGDAAVARLAAAIGRTVPRGQLRTVIVPPEKYNALHAELGSVDRILGWAFARALEDLLACPEPCEQAIADRFGDPRHVAEALMEKGRRVRLTQTPKAEREIAVAAASVLARDSYLRALARLEQELGAPLPRGAGTGVDEAGRRLVAEKGRDVLGRVAKVHFANTARVVG